ncbi:prolipoprotein diacylglyceryl transferase [Flavobacteriaceae bacterium]|jgi:phosphatidylglycerol:prolipoprotein diacylglycerol transferase|nr:prolipoprotein diacylglyceryl transferase [Flavobacteriaceae bacterium]MDC0917032.1 prolipoprotein diacylglyceryl transferase [Flavobacteriaceae bacterium]MDC1012226.1 prolipoprotein diacylglyceryl transferase [Flavobacteriaceae bacterium]MDC3330224.1 prolipoprotein diacylglyceryl transferase [Flavobacteriaceae bacterium]
MYFTKIDWAPSETLFKIGSFGIHYYSLMFIIAFGLGYYLMKKIFDEEKISLEYLESLFIYMVLSILLGARLGDVFFYSWDYYQDHLLEILLPIRDTPNGYTFTGFRGLASHGAVIGSLLGLYLYKRKFKERSLFWLLDRVTIPVAVGASFVRLGNFFNSEIVGKYSNSNFGVVFLNRGENLPRHPAQLYEAVGYLILFFILRQVYHTEKKKREGYLIGLFFIGMFTIRFLIEFIKESQGGFEEILGLLSTGQWLSIPFVLFGILLMYRSRNQITE